MNNLDLMKGTPLYILFYVDDNMKILVFFVTSFLYYYSPLGTHLNLPPLETNRQVLLCTNETTISPIGVFIFFTRGSEAATGFDKMLIEGCSFVRSGK
jgi:hypothetical protein